ncbi:MAG: hypothetical protein ABIJ80_01700, partial [Patescibacteria group bacterium]
GYYGRAMSSFSKNSLAVNVPRTRTGLFSPVTLELLKINREKVDEIAFHLGVKPPSGTHKHTPPSVIKFYFFSSAILVSFFIGLFFLTSVIGHLF